MAAVTTSIFRVRRVTAPASTRPSAPDARLSGAAMRVNARAARLVVARTRVVARETRLFAATAHPAAMDARIFLADGVVLARAMRFHLGDMLGPTRATRASSADMRVAGRAMRLFDADVHGNRRRKRQGRSAVSVSFADELRCAMFVQLVRRCPVPLARPARGFVSDLDDVEPERLRMVDDADVARGERHAHVERAPDDLAISRITEGLEQPRALDRRCRIQWGNPDLGTLDGVAKPLGRRQREPQLALVHEQRDLPERDGGDV